MVAVTLFLLLSLSLPFPSLDTSPFSLPLSHPLPSPWLSCSTFAGNTHGINPRAFLRSSAFVLLFLPYVLSTLYLFPSPFLLAHPLLPPSREQRDTHRRRARRAEPTLLSSFSSISTRLIARSRTTGVELLAVGTPLFFFAKSTPAPRPGSQRIAAALSPSSIINSVNDQIYGGRAAAAATGPATDVCGFSARCETIACSTGAICRFTRPCFLVVSRGLLADSIVRFSRRADKLLANTQEVLHSLRAKHQNRSAAKPSFARRNVDRSNILSRSIISFVGANGWSLSRRAMSSLESQRIYGRTVAPRSFRPVRLPRASLYQVSPCEIQDPTVPNTPDKTGPLPFVPSRARIEHGIETCKLVQSSAPIGAAAPRLPRAEYVTALQRFSRDSEASRIEDWSSQHKRLSLWII